FVLVLALVFLIEALALGWNRSSLRRILVDRDTSSRTDLLCWAIWALRYLYTLPVFGLGYLSVMFSKQIVQAATGLDLTIQTGNIAADIALYLPFYSLCDYWTHRLAHCGPLWFLHRLHHSATALSPLVSHRNHALQVALEPAVKIWPLAFFPLPP